MDDADSVPNQQELADELEEVERRLATATRQLDDLRRARSEPDALPDTSDDAVLIREFEDQETIVAQLEAHRRSLLDKQGSGSA